MTSINEERGEQPGRERRLGERVEISWRRIEIDAIARIRQSSSGDVPHGTAGTMAEPRAGQAAHQAYTARLGEVRINDCKMPTGGAGSPAACT